MLVNFPTKIVIKGLPQIFDQFLEYEQYEAMKDMSQSLMNEMKRCVQFSKAAYRAPANSKKNSIVSRKPELYLQRDDTEVYIWTYPDGRIYFSFRGTKGLEDVLDDIDIRHRRFGIHQGVHVHAGFYRQWTDIFPSIDREIASLLKKNKAAGLTSTLIFTGHSLGGAIATLAALEYAEKGLPVECYTFGSPRVGNHKFCAVFEKKVPIHWRVINEKDPVPTLPFGPRFYHVGPALCLTDKGGIHSIPSDVPWYRRIFDPVANFDILKPGKEHQSAAYVARVLAL